MPPDCEPRMHSAQRAQMNGPVLTSSMTLLLLRLVAGAGQSQTSAETKGRFACANTPPFAPPFPLIHPTPYQPNRRLISVLIRDNMSGVLKALTPGSPGMFGNKKNVRTAVTF